MYRTLVQCCALRLHMLVLCLSGLCPDLLLVLHVHLWASCSEIKITGTSAYKWEGQTRKLSHVVPHTWLWYQAWLKLVISNGIYIQGHQLEEWFESCPVSIKSFSYSLTASTAQPKWEIGYKFHASSTNLLWHFDSYKFRVELQEGYMKYT